jgi:hypothetical protein
MWIINFLVFSLIFGNCKAVLLWICSSKSGEYFYGSVKTNESKCWTYVESTQDLHETIEGINRTAQSITIHQFDKSYVPIENINPIVDQILNSSNLKVLDFAIDFSTINNETFKYGGNLEGLILGDPKIKIIKKKHFFSNLRK